MVAMVFVMRVVIVVVVVVISVIEEVMVEAAVVLVINGGESEWHAERKGEMDWRMLTLVRF